MQDAATFFWLVGLFEGEASFRYKASERTPVIELEMTDEHVIARVASLFDISYSRRDRRERRNDSMILQVTYRVSLKGGRAMQLMTRMQPFLSPRRARQIDLVEELYLAGRWNTIDYANLPLPPLTSVPFSVTRG